MRQALKRLVPTLFDRQAKPDPVYQGGAPVTDEIVLSLVDGRKAQCLADLRQVLRADGAGAQFPLLSGLESAIDKNARRVRIPLNVQPGLVREFAMARGRLNRSSPLWEIVNAAHEKAKAIAQSDQNDSARISVAGQTTDSSSLLDDQTKARETELRELIASKRARYKTGKPKPRVEFPSEKAQAIPYRADVNEQRQLLVQTAANVEAIELKTGELSDADLSGYLDLCSMAGDRAKVLETLRAILPGRPCAWMWVRLLDELSTMSSPHLTAWRSHFNTWVNLTHPEWLPDMLEQDGPTVALRHGVIRQLLEAQIAQELHGNGQ